MNKKDLTKLAMLGLSAGLLGGCGGGTSEAEAGSEMHKMEKMTEEQLMSKLNADSRRMYDSMDAESKEQVLSKVSHSCGGESSCNGKSGCGGDSGCGGSDGAKMKGAMDPNMTVKEVYKSMMEKRQNSRY